MSSPSSRGSGLSPPVASDTTRNAISLTSLDFDLIGRFCIVRSVYHGHAITSSPARFKLDPLPAYAYQFTPSDDESRVRKRPMAGS